MMNMIHARAEAMPMYPDGVVVTERQEGKTTVLEVRVADGDMGKVIGKQGRIAKAIRSVVKAAATKDNKRLVYCYG